MVLLFAYLALAATALAQTEGNVTIMVVDPEGAAMPFIVGQTRTDFHPTLSDFGGLIYPTEPTFLI